MPSVIPDAIFSRFAPWVNCDCWVMCDGEKHPLTIHGGNYIIPTEQHPTPPYHYAACSMLRWKKEPQDHITNLKRIDLALNAFCVNYCVYGFGVMLGLHNCLVCFDFDHVIAKDGSIPEKVREFLDALGTFVEVSSSGTGLHAFCGVDGEAQEYTFNPEICDGKCYYNRFAKLTGKIFENFDLPIKFIDERDFDKIRRNMGNAPAYTPSQSSTPYNGEQTEWSKVLAESHIRFEVIPNYKDTTRKHGDVTRVSKWACKVQCPQAHLHTGYASRKNLFNPDVAILTTWNDGTTSLVCGHNHCSWQYHPNLLKQLWVQVKAQSPLTRQRANTHELLKSLGVV